jgi:hypothetical protein
MNYNQTINAPTIQQTTDYIFKLHPSNRPINDLHVKSLIKSMKENYLFTLITVNDKYEICDGQHRYEAIKQLNLPLNFVIIPGYGESEMRRLNSNTSNWSNDDYLKCFVNQGNEDYIKYQDFKQAYKLNHSDSQKILKWRHQRSYTAPFRNGEFKIYDYDKACDFMDKLLMIKPYYAGYKRTHFIHAMMTLSNNKLFNFDEFLLKLKLQPTSLVDCIRTEAYIELIERIYNFKRKDRVNLRFS